MAAARLTLLLACLGLAISRVGLVAHEVFGHGGAAVAFGGRVLEVTFFWFAGGWIRYSTPALDERGALLIQLGGILTELGLGLAACLYARLAVLARQRRQARRGGSAPPPSYPLTALELGGLLFIAHGLWYAATGTWHGFGDGARLHALLGEARYPVALLLGALLCATAAGAARRLARAFAPSFASSFASSLGSSSAPPSTSSLGSSSGSASTSTPAPSSSSAAAPSTPRRLALVLLAAVLAGGLHAALTFGEVRLRQDHVYRLTMRTAEERTRDRELARWRQAQAERGHVVAPAEEQAKARALTPPAPFPFARALALAALLAVALGAASLRRAPLPAERGFPVITRAMLAGTAALAFATIAAVVLLDAW